jgi:hypothetical protein
MRTIFLGDTVEILDTGIRGVVIATDYRTRIDIRTTAGEVMHGLRIAA